MLVLKGSELSGFEMAAHRTFFNARPTWAKLINHNFWIKFYVPFRTFVGLDAKCAIQHLRNRDFKILSN